jgi:O-antigen/teichoic acid export membrane protein
LSEQHRPPASGIRGVAKTGAIAVLEEGLFAGSNFLIGVLLGRWLEPADYGAFTSAYYLFLLFAMAFHFVIFVQPILVFGSRDYGARFEEYLGCILWLHAAFSGIISLVTAILAVLCWYAGAVAFAKIFLALTVVGPLITLLWLARRAHYARQQPHLPLGAAILYVMLVVSGCYVLYRMNALSATSSLLVIGVASLASSIPLIMLIGPKRWVRQSDLTPRSMLALHWQYAKWSVLTACLRWSSNYAYYLLLPLFLGLEATAALRAHMNLLLPILHANSAVFGTLIPQFSKIFDQQRGFQLGRFTLEVLALYAGGALIFWVLLMVFAEQIFGLLYGGRYVADMRLLAPLGLLPLSGGIAGVLESALFAAGRSKLATLSYNVSAAVTLTVGVALVMTLGLVGAGIGLLAASIATAAAMAALCVRLDKTKKLAVIP